MLMKIPIKLYLVHEDNLDFTFEIHGVEENDDESLLGFGQMRKVSLLEIANRLEEYTYTPVVR
jgi:hypothetical protein